MLFSLKVVLFFFFFCDSVCCLSCGQIVHSTNVVFEYLWLKYHMDLNATILFYFLIPKTSSSLTSSLPLTNAHSGLPHPITSLSSLPTLSATGDTEFALCIYFLHYMLLFISFGVLNLVVTCSFVSCAVQCLYPF